MTRYGMLINTKKCVGCSACRIACQMKNHLDPEESFIKYHEIETGEYPNVYNEIVPTQCMHCEDAPCAAVCPTHATYITIPAWCWWTRKSASAASTAWLRVLTAPASCRRRPVWWRSAASAGTAKTGQSAGVRGNLHFGCAHLRRSGRPG